MSGAAVDPVPREAVSTEALDLALVGAELPALLVTVARASGRTVWALAPDGTITGRAVAPLTEAGPGRSLDTRLVLPHRSGPDAVDAFHLVIDGEPARVLALVHRGEHIGHLAVGLLARGALHRVDPDPVATADRVLHSHSLALVVHLVGRQAARPAMVDMGTWLIHELQRPGSTSSASLAAVAADLGLDLDQPFAAAVVSCDEVPEHRWVAALRWTGRPVASIGTRALTLLVGEHDDDLDDLVRHLGQALDGAPLLAAAGPVVHDPGSAARSFEQAEVVHALLREDPALRRLSPADLGVTGVLLELPSWQLADFADRRLGPIDDKGDLVETLRVWLDERGNRSAVADRLFVHRNSVAHRLRRLAALLEVDLGRPEVWLDLWCALEARRVLRARAVVGHG